MAAKNFGWYLVSLIFFLANATHGQESLCDHCQCKQLYATVDCSRKAIKDMPGGDLWPNNTRYIDLSFNFISSLITAHEEPALKVLSLSSNNISDVREGFFQNFWNLEVLDLSNNRLGDQSMHPSTFNGLETSLKVLNISRNNLRSLSDNLLNKLTQLEELVLSNNPLRYLKSEWFMDLALLRRLDISFIGAHDLPVDIFHPMYNLHFIDLSSNDFDLVPTKPLRSAQTLKVLKINGNPIPLLDEQSFKNLPTLEEIYIEDLPHLSVIRGGTFAGLPKLRLLSIENNQLLREFESPPFGNDVKVDKLSGLRVSLRQNRLRHLSSDLLDLCTSASFDFQLNPWQCDCFLSWMPNCSFRHEHTIALKCSGPRPMKGKQLVELSSSDFPCEYGESQLVRHAAAFRTTVLLASVLTLFIILMLIVVVWKRRSITNWMSGHRGAGDKSVYYVKARSSNDSMDM